MSAQCSSYSGLALVSGWGTTTEQGELATILRKVSVPIITDEKCKEAYGSEVYETMLCAGMLQAIKIGFGWDIL